MSNRYSKTGYTARQVKTLRSLQYDLERIFMDRRKKNDSQDALKYLLRAREMIEVSIRRSEEHKSSDS